MATGARCTGKRGGGGALLVCVVHSCGITFANVNSILLHMCTYSHFTPWSSDRWVRVSLIAVGTKTRRESIVPRCSEGTLTSAWRKSSSQIDDSTGEVIVLVGLVFCDTLPAGEAAQVSRACPTDFHNAEARIDLHTCYP